MYLPRDQLLAGARLTEDQDWGIRTCHQFDSLHDRGKPRVRSHHGVDQLCSAEPRQQRAFVGLGRGPQGDRLAVAAVIANRRGKRLQEHLGRIHVRFGKRGGLVSGQPKEPQQPADLAKRPDDQVAPARSLRRENCTCTVAEFPAVCETPPAAWQASTFSASDGDSFALEQGGITASAPTAAEATGSRQALLASNSSTPIAPKGMMPATIFPIVPTDLSNSGCWQISRQTPMINSRMASRTVLL